MSSFALLLGMAYLTGLPPMLRATDVPTNQAAPAATILDKNAVRGILGRTVRDADGKEMGRVIDVVIDPAGRVRAAVIDFGGFLGVGSRKIAVDWGALEFGKAVKHGDDVSLALTQDQLKAAPEYKEGNAVIVIGSTGELEPLNNPASNAPEH